MPLNEKKIISLIMEQAREIPDRAMGYGPALIEAISDIIQAERQHRVHGTSIQQKVNDKCNALGEFLAQQRGGSSGRADS